MTSVLAVAGLVVIGDATILGVYLGSDARVSPLGVVAVAASLIRIGAGLAVVRRASALLRSNAVRARSAVGRDARR